MSIDHETRFNRIEERLNAVEKRDAVSEVHHKNVVRRLDAIDDTQKWIVRLILGAMIMGIVGFALQGGFTP